MNLFFFILTRKNGDKSLGIGDKKVLKEKMEYFRYSCIQNREKKL